MMERARAVCQTMIARLPMETGLREMRLGMVSLPVRGVAPGGVPVYPRLRSGHHARA
jgi:hypothetical protein